MFSKYSFFVISPLIFSLTVSCATASPSHEGGGQSSTIAGQPVAVSGGRADALWNLISLCVNAPVSKYCECPAMIKTCCGDPDTPDASVVWSLNDDYLVIRDLRQCGCQKGFITAITMPRMKVTGIEDTKRPEGIWRFSWDAAARVIPESSEIGLTINPQGRRSQNQMHIHIQRIKSETRKWFDDPALRKDAIGKYNLIFIDLDDLGGVFKAVGEKVGSSRMKDTGILAVKSRNAGYQAMITFDKSPEAFVEKFCDKK